MSSQPWRRYALGLSIANESLRVHCYDRSGAIISRPYDIHEKPLALIRVIASLAFADRNRLGFDPTIRLALVSDLLSPSLNGPIGRVMGRAPSTVYDILEIVWSSQGFIGRGTTVYRVRSKEGKEYVLKDYWVKANEAGHEAAILEKIASLKIDGVPTLVEKWNVQFNGQDDTTETLRKGLIMKHLPASFCARIHRRLLMTPVGFPISSFRSQRELLSGLRDVIRSRLNM
ncbi:hypothetical protein BV22DRAFT_1020824 [Leucogyrophana mollusca]|uniref:Uncharacterized protein n=1 Tax=Leucogyrophana mollusca TaxID=85980 RepID=A0ACB8B5F1_9AGAM|nr:hypothetical protein BV22DRAFT_1020824 [Leucogyrophana mollusca]